MSKTLLSPALPRFHPRALLASTVLDRVLPILLIAFLSFAYAQGIALVPFHPDESTYLYMSSDFEQMLKSPASLAWNPDRASDPRQLYRLLDPPLNRLALGFARSLAGLSPPPADWNWSLSWEANARNGALPSPDLLFTGRLVAAVFFPLSLAFLYQAGRTFSGRLGSLLTILFLGTNTLILLHTRRAMSESGLLLGITAFLACLPSAHRRPWLAGLALALAFSAKHSSLALLPAGLAAAVWFPAGEEGKIRRALMNSSQLIGVFGLITLALNPVIWGNSFGAARAALEARQELLARQLADVERLAASQVLETPGERAVALLANLYLMPPAFAETANYRAETARSESIYLDSPVNNIWRSPLGAAFLLSATLLGLVGFSFAARRDPARRRFVLLLLLAGGFQAAAMLLTVPLPWQRYSLPLLPFTCLLAGTGISWLVSWFTPVK